MLLVSINILPGVRYDLKNTFLIIMSKNIDEIIDKLKVITLLEASELIRKIEETFGVDTSALNVAAANSSNLVGGAKAEVAPVEEKTEFDVIIQEVPAPKRITVIKVIRSITSLGLKEAKDLIESLPKVVSEAVSKEKSEEIKKLLVEAGASVIIK